MLSPLVIALVVPVTRLPRYVATFSGIRGSSSLENAEPTYMQINCSNTPNWNDSFISDIRTAA